MPQAFYRSKFHTITRDPYDNDPYDFQKLFFPWIEIHSIWYWFIFQQKYCLYNLWNIVNEYFFAHLVWWWRLQTRLNKTVFSFSLSSFNLIRFSFMLDFPIPVFDLYFCIFLLFFFVGFIFHSSFVKH